MNYFIKVMKDDFNGTMSNAEFNAMIGLEVFRQCSEYQDKGYELSLSNEFYKIVDLENGQKLPRVAKFLQSL